MNSIVLLHGGNEAGWMWQPQVERVPGRHLLAPGPPGHGTRTDEPWNGMGDAADDIAAAIRSRSIGGEAHLVGSSLGGIVSIHLLRRHPEVVRTWFARGSATTGYTRPKQVLLGALVALWRYRWYWVLHALAFGIPEDSREQYVADAGRVSAQTNRGIFRQAVTGALPRKKFDVACPVLAVRVGRDTRSVCGVADFEKHKTPRLSGAPVAPTGVDPVTFRVRVSEYQELLRTAVTSIIPGQASR